MTNAEFIAETITKYHADVLNILGNLSFSVVEQ